jgi:hypothetical protein
MGPSQESIRAFAAKLLNKPLTHVRLREMMAAEPALVAYLDGANLHAAKGIFEENLRAIVE